MKTRALAILLSMMLVFSLGAIIPSPAQASPEDNNFVPPIITHPDEIDQDFNGIEDALESKIVASSKEELEEPIAVIVILKQPYTETDLDSFLSLDGGIKHKYDRVTYGFSGNIPLSKINELAESLGDKLNIIEQDRPTEASLDVSTQIIRVRNTVWNTYGYRGDPNSAIAVIDSGIDDSHTDLSGYQDAAGGWPAANIKIVGWDDETAASTTSPVDYSGHGTHTASIAAGTGASIGSGTITQITTTFYGILPPDGYGWTDRIVLPTTGDITLNMGWSGTGTAWMRCEDTIGSNMGEYTSSSSPFTHIYDATIAGLYWPICGNVSGLQGEPFSTLETYPYADVGDGENLFTGVAPETRLVGVRVFSGYDGLGGYVSDLTAGYEWVIANKNTYRIKAATSSITTTEGGINITLRNAADTVVTNGIVFTVSAANDYPDYTIGDPGLASKVITVGATNDEDGIAQYSSNGGAGSNKPDVAAPGGSSNVASRIIAVDTNDCDSEVSTFADRNANDYIKMKGTSMSTPHVGGLAALVIQAMEDMGLTWTWSETDALKVKSIILMTAGETNNAVHPGESDNDPPLNRGTNDLVEGYGRINADAAIEAVTMSYTIGTTAQDTLGANPTDKRVWARQVSLTGGQEYTFSLTVPTGADFDLYLYDGTDPAAGTAGTPVILEQSTAAATGGTETITYTPASTTAAYIVVKWVSGSGQFSLADTTPPYTSGHDPAPGATDVPISTNIVVHVLDDGDGVDTATIVMTVEGAPVTPDITGTSADYTLTYDPPADFAYLQVVDVTIDASDLASLGNAMTQDAYSFTTQAAPNTPPVLSDGVVSPETGYVTTEFTYSVTYTDADNDPPASPTVSIDGGDPIEMTEQDAEDEVYTDGKVYQYATSGLVKDITHNFQFAASDGVDAATGDTGVHTGPTVENTPPSVANVSITPDPAYTDTDLTATPSGWSDLDGDTEGYQYQWQKLDGSWQDISGATTNTLDSSNFVKDDQIKVICTPFDGTDAGSPVDDTIIISNSPPELSGGGVSPATGDVTTSFTYSVTYTDADDDPPASPTVSIDGGTAQGMTVKAEEDGVYTNGEIYEYTTSGLDTGSHTFQFAASDGVDDATGDTGIHAGPGVENNPPVLSGGQVSPETGYVTTEFTYSVTYTDADNDPPASPTVSIDGGDPIEMTEQDAEDEVYTDGKVYQYATSGLSKDSHTFQFAASDGVDAATGDTGVHTGPTVENSSPSVANVSITPDPAYTDTGLTATPSGWDDADGDTEGYQYQWQKWDGDSWEDIGGAITNTLDSSNFVKDDQIKVICTPFDGTDAGSPVEDDITISNSPPIAPVVDVTPDLPLTSDDLVCTITTPSTDPDDDSITYSYAWYKNDELQSGLTTDTVDSANTAKGEVWKCVVTPNDSTSDGSTGEDEVTIRNSPPIAPVVDVTPDSPVTSDNLVCTITIPSTDPDDDSITYSYAWYKNDELQPGLTTDTVDSANTAKGEVWKCVVTPNDLTIDGPTGEDEVTIQNTPPSVANVSITPDPAYTDTGLTATPSGWSDLDGDTEGYQYQWQKWDGDSWEDIGSATTNTLDSSNFVKDDQIKVICTPFDGTETGTPVEDDIIISNSPPELSGGGVSPATGDVTTSFTYSVTYTDADDDPPASPTVSIDGDTAQGMTVKAEEDGVYTNGEIYEYTTSGLITGSHTFQFAASDGVDDATGDTGIHYGPGVENNPPVLSGGQVSPETGYVTTEFTYSVTYTDADNDPPASPTVSIDGGDPIEMTEQDAGDTGYIDGKVYQYATSGLVKDITHTFQFAASDGVDAATGDTGVHTGPTVENTPPSVANVSITPDPAYTDTGLTATPSGWDDADGDTEGYQYQWQKLDGSWQDISGANTNTLDSSNFVKDDQIKVICTPFDGTDTGTPVEDDIIISNSLPTANAGPDQRALINTPITLDGSASSDPDGDTLTYAWTQTEGAVVTLSDETAVDPTFTPTAADTYTFSLVVNDGTDDSLPDTVVITVRETNTAPVLSDGTVDPASGYTSTTFIYSVVYTDDDNDSPMPITITIDGGTPQNMTVKAEEDGDFTNGEIYEYTTTGANLGLGTHTFQFAANDGIDDATGDIGSHSGPTISSPPAPEPRDTTPPRLSDISASNITKISVIIEWKTPERSTSQVEYWASEHMFSPLDERLVIYHEVELTNLNPCTVYHYQTISKDRSGNEAISEEDTFTTLGTPATFASGGLTISPTEADIGESVTISVVVANTGDAKGTYEVTLKIDNVVVATKDITLAGGTSEEVTFTISRDVPGTYATDINGLSATFVVKAAVPEAAVPEAAPAAFTTTALTMSPAEVDIGESVTISVLVANTGDATGTHQITLKIDNVVIATKEVTLAGGASQEVTFTTAKDVAGTYAVNIDGLSGTFTVKAPPVVPVPPKPWWVSLWWIWVIVAVVVVVGLVVWMVLLRPRRA